jgi:DNA-binding transcriptional regulator YbjK
VVGTGGMRELTHRAVDAAAGLPLGSTSNRFRTREALVTGLLGRILARETAVWAEAATAERTASLADFAAATGQLLVVLTTDERVLSQARRAIFVEATRSAAVRDEIDRAQAQLAAWMEPLLAELGSPDARGDVRHLLALIDGLVGLQLANPRPDFDPATAVEALLRGLVEPRPPRQRSRT